MRSEDGAPPRPPPLTALGRRATGHPRHARPLAPVRHGLMHAFFGIKPVRDELRHSKAAAAQRGHSAVSPGCGPYAPYARPVGHRLRPVGHRLRPRHRSPKRSFNSFGAVV